MDMKILITLLLLAGIVIVGGILYSDGISANDEIPRISVENLKKLLDDSETEHLIILDVRTGASWAESNQIIQTAIREEPNNFDSWGNKYPKDATIVLYCT